MVGIGIGISTALLCKDVSVAVLPSYWLTFDGTNDIITLPSGHGQEPTTALFIEAWVQNIPADGSHRVFICRGSFFDQGYTLSLVRAATNTVTVMLALDTTTGDFLTEVNIGKVLFDTLPIYIAAGWDGTTIYFFVNGVLLATAAKDGTLEYSGTQWLIGAMPGPVWPNKGNLGAMRVSDVCRHTTTYAIPLTWSADANTIGMWLNQEGSGTALADSSGNAHDGVFLGAGEPAWGAEVDLSILSHGEAIWAACLDVVPAVTERVYVKRIDADTYYLYKKIHADGYWAKWELSRDGTAALALTGAWTGQTSTNDPETWAADPATQLMQGGANEYVFEGKIGAGANVQWGNAHGGEALDSEEWLVDGVPTVLGNGDYSSGDTIALHAFLHFDDGVTPVCTIERTLTIRSSAMYIEGDYTFDWLVDWIPTEQIYPAMTYYQTTNVDTCTFVPGGTDFAIDGLHDFNRAHAAAAWKADNGCIMASWVDPDAGLRQNARGAFLSVTFRKLYFNRTNELYGAYNGKTWSYKARWMALDNCGNHFLKTT